MPINSHEIHKLCYSDIADNRIALLSFSVPTITVYRFAQYLKVTGLRTVQMCQYRSYESVVFRSARRNVCECLRVRACVQ